MGDTVAVPKHFNGPLESGNGGYSAGAIAAFVDGDVAEVSLRSPVPLDSSLQISREGDALRIFDGETLVAEARPVEELGVEPPEPVGLEAARAASERYRGLRGGPFSRCFVCGLDREDALGVFAGEVEGREMMVASPWTPPGWAADENGVVRPEIVWGVLDCPTYFAAHLRRYPLPVSFLVRQATRIDAPVRAGEEHIVIAWPLGADGRKHEAASAVLSADGETLALARALLVEPRQAG